MHTSSISSFALNRREFIGAMTALGVTSSVRADRQTAIAPHEIGITSASFAWLGRPNDPTQVIALGDIPAVTRNEMGLRILDLNTSTLGSHEARHISNFARQASAAGCLITNLKINIQESIADPDESRRKRAMEEYRSWIRAAADLGARWVLPIADRTPPRWDLLVAGFRQLCDFAEPLGLRLLVENYRWLESEPAAMPKLIKDLGGRISAQPDTLNWKDDATRVAGLTASFPLAVSCDFKLKELTDDGKHPAFDLKECFDTGIRGGFKGPWCIEHVNVTRKRLIEQVRFIKEMLSRWIAESAKK